MASGAYRLSAALKGHEDDVRGVVFPSPNEIISVSRDATVRLWQRNPSAVPTTFSDHINSTGSAFVNCVTFLPPTRDYPKGLIVSGGQDTIIEVREPESVKPDAEFLLLGHAHNVCALDNSAGIIVSGSWDGTARVWQNWETKYVLEGHQGSVWAVLVLSETEIVTGSADKTIRLWRNGKLVKIINGHTDVVRGLCRLPNRGFASCANDGTIRIWSSDGHQLQELHGHTSYIYSITVLPTGELVSSGEDRTIRIWKDGECNQTITHPAISVWGVAVCENGDIVSGASDRLVRVFSRERSRWASEEAIKAFDDSVAASSIPANQVGDIKKDKLPGPEALQQPGKKDGQVIMVRNGDTVEAHVWSSQAKAWNNVGTVVDAVGSGRKQLYEGKEYDFVFDVDIQEGAPALKLPYNLSQNPFEAARKFLENNELPISYLDTVGNFIVKNTEGVSIGQQEPERPDPFAENRYRPDGNTSNSSALPRQNRPRYLPQKTYLSITTANLSTIQKKLHEINHELLQKGEKDISLNPEELLVLTKFCTFLQSTASSDYKPSQTPPPIAVEGLSMLVKIVTTWPAQQRLPGLDLLRLLAAATSVIATNQLQGGLNLVNILEGSGAFSKDTPNNAMLATRTFVNMAQTEEGRNFLYSNFEEIFELVKSSAAGTSNRNMKVAQITMLLNYATLFASRNLLEQALVLFGYLVSIIRTEIDSETVFRALVALGTILNLGGEIKEAAVGVYQLKQVVEATVGRVKEPRIRDIGGEISALL
ncbi:WD repeat protein Lub1 [Rhizina undulata]